MDGLDLADRDLLRRDLRAAAADDGPRDPLSRTTPRRRLLRLETTRGDRLFISLLGVAFIHLAWLGLSAPPLWGALVVCLFYRRGGVSLGIGGMKEVS